MEKRIPVYPIPLEETQNLMEGQTHALYKVEKVTAALVAFLEVSRHHLGVHGKGIAIGCSQLGKKTLHFDGSSPHADPPHQGTKRHFSCC